MVAKMKRAPGESMGTRIRNKKLLIILKLQKSESKMIIKIVLSIYLIYMMTNLINLYWGLNIKNENRFSILLMI